MSRSLPAILATCALALTILLSGCGGGGGGGGGSNGGTDGGSTDPGVVRNNSGEPISGATITYYTASGTAIRTDTLNSSGRPRNVPSNAARFAVNVSSVTNSSGNAYYNTFLFDGLFYDYTVGCAAPLSGSDFPTDIVFFAQGGDTIPPPPNGCVGQ